MRSAAQQSDETCTYNTLLHLLSTVSKAAELSVKPSRPPSSSSVKSSLSCLELRLQRPRKTLIKLWGRETNCSYGLCIVMIRQTSKRSSVRTLQLTHLLSRRELTLHLKQVKLPATRVSARQPRSLQAETYPRRWGRTLSTSCCAGRSPSSGL